MCEGWGGAGSRPSGPDSETGATCHSGPPAATTGGCGGEGDDTRLQWRRRRLQGGRRGGDAALPKPPPIKEGGGWLWQPGMALAGRIRRLLPGCTSHFCSPASSGPSWVRGSEGRGQPACAAHGTAPRGETRRQSFPWRGWGQSLPPRGRGGDLPSRGGASASPRGNTGRLGFHGNTIAWRPAQGMTSSE